MAQAVDDIATERAPYTAPGPRFWTERRAFTALMLVLDTILILFGFSLAYRMRYTIRWPAPFESIVREVAAENFVPPLIITPSYMFSINSREASHSSFNDRILTLVRLNAVKLFT